jgi:hypothetical protein
MAWAISGAYGSWVSRDSMMRTPAAATPRGDLGGELARDLVSVVAQRQFTFPAAGVGVAGGYVPDGGHGHSRTTAQAPRPRSTHVSQVAEET